ncbi:MAG: tyrosine-type recombinase/integrase, partial [bacterium]|nr:tyrosine-type recombinase/integrase [bacterium]
MAKSLKDFKFSVFERQDRKGWWYRYWLTDTKRSPQMAVMVLVRRLGLQEDYPKVKNKKQAERIVVQAYTEGIIKLSRGSKESLVDYLLDFWDFSGTRIRRLNKRRPGAVSENYASIMRGYIKTHIVPLVGKGMEVADVTPKFVRDISNKLIDPGTKANATVDKIMVAFTKPLRDAWKNDMIHENPTKLVERMDTSPKRQRGILTRSEFQQVLVILKAKATEHVYLAVLLAAATGMRLGEIRALYASDINVVNEQDAIVNVSKSWSIKGGEKTTKGKKVRSTPCPSWLANKLLAMASRNTTGSSLVFWSIGGAKDGGPVASSYIREHFYWYLYDVLEQQAGIKVGTMVEDTDATERGRFNKEGKPLMVRAGEMMRRRRNISFHSFRHFFNTEAQALGADGDKLRLTVGHESKAMTDNYTH